MFIELYGEIPKNEPEDKPGWLTRNKAESFLYIYIFVNFQRFQEFQVIFRKLLRSFTKLLFTQKKLGLMKI